MFKTYALKSVFLRCPLFPNRARSTR